MKEQIVKLIIGAIGSALAFITGQEGQNGMGSKPPSGQPPVSR